MFLFNQKTAYEMRISDWSSDVCSSDLPDRACQPDQHLVGPDASAHARSPPDRAAGVLRARAGAREAAGHDAGSRQGEVLAAPGREIGRASGWERVCQYV